MSQKEIGDKDEVGYVQEVGPEVVPAVKQHPPPRKPRQQNKPQAPRQPNQGQVLEERWRPGEGNMAREEGKLGTRARKGIAVCTDSSSKRKAEEESTYQGNKRARVDSSSEDNGAQDQPAQRGPGMGKNMKLIMKAAVKI